MESVRYRSLIIEGYLWLLTSLPTLRCASHRWVKLHVPKSEFKMLLVYGYSQRNNHIKSFLFVNSTITDEQMWSIQSGGSQSLKFLLLGSAAHTVESEFYDRIYLRNLNQIRKYFRYTPPVAGEAEQGQQQQRHGEPQQYLQNIVIISYACFTFIPTYITRGMFQRRSMAVRW